MRVSSSLAESHELNLSTPAFEGLGDKRPLGRHDWQKAAIIHSALECISLFGLQKTSVEDIAKRASLSRSTVYRLFPKGKEDIFYSAFCSETERLFTQINDALKDVDSVDGAIVEAIWVGFCFLYNHRALRFVLVNEPDTFAQILSFDNVAKILEIAHERGASLFAGFVSADEGSRIAEWIARIVISYLALPSKQLDLTDKAQVERFVSDFITPGLGYICQNN